MCRSPTWSCTWSGRSGRGPAELSPAQDHRRRRQDPGADVLYEIHDIRRFPDVGEFLSYARLVRCGHESAGKKLGSGGKKIGNAHLKWAFAEAACLFLRGSERGKQWKQKQEKK